MWSPVWSGIRTYKPSSFTYTPLSDEKAVDCTSCERGIGKGVKENRDSCKCNKHLSHSFPKLVQFCGHGESKGPLYTLLLPKVCQNQIIALRIFLSKVRSSPDKAKENSKPTELPPPPPPKWWTEVFKPERSFIHVINQNPGSYDSKLFTRNAQTSYFPERV